MPIVVSKDEWARIKKWTNEDKTDPETIRRREYIQFLDDSSRKMTKKWPNSLENVNKRNEEIRQARIDAAEQANTKFYKKYVKRQKEDRARMMYSARDTIFKNKDAPKLLLSAVIETVIQKERGEQVKFNKELRKMSEDQKRADDDEIIRKAKEWHELMEQRKKLRFEVNKKHQKELVDQVQEIEEKQRKEFEAELKMQQADNMKANEEMDALKDFDEKYKAAEKVRIWKDMERSKQENEQRKALQAALDKMDDNLLEVLNKSRARVQKKCKQTEKELRDEKRRILDKISQKLESGEANRDAKEQASLNKAIKEKEAAEDAARLERERKQARIRAERAAAHQQFLRDDLRRQQDRLTTMQWEAMNRFKNQEIYEDFKEEKRKEKEHKIKEYREEILRLWKEREDREAQELKDRRYFYGELALQKFRDADNKLLTHAAALLDEARAHGRPDHSLHRAIDRYCKLYRLYPMPPLPLSLQEHFRKYAPWDGSKPDPWYVEPPPPDEPPRATATNTASSERDKVAPDAGKRDGMQEVKPGPSKPAKEPQESLEDYKRIGPANGMQRRFAQVDVTLPPINVPCPSATCKCELKK